MADDGGSLAVAADQMNIGPGFPDCIQKVDRRGDAADRYLRRIEQQNAGIPGGKACNR